MRTDEMPKSAELRALRGLSVMEQSRNGIVLDQSKMPGARRKKKMVAKSTATRKQKGREHQQQIATQIRTALDLPEEDVVSRPMGSQGLDVMLSARARERFPFGIECKRQEKLAIPEWWRQCEENARKEGLTPLLVFRRSHEDALAVMRWADLLALVRWSNRDGDCRWRNLTEAITGERV